MIYFSRDEVEKVGVAGSAKIIDEHGIRWRYLSSFWLYVEKNDLAFTPHAPTGYWEAWVTKWVSQEFDKHDVFIDVGANVGYYTLMAATHGMPVCSIEPNPEVAKMIHLSAAANNVVDLVEVYEGALSDKEETLNLFIPPGHSGGAFLTENGYEQNVVPVQAGPFDTGYDIPRFQHMLMKIDAEGAEPRIWEGMQRHLEKNPMTVFLEWDGSRYDSVSFAKRLFEQPYVGLVDYSGNDQRLTFPEELVRLEGIHTVVVRNEKMMK